MISSQSFSAEAGSYCTGVKFESPCCDFILLERAQAAGRAPIRDTRLSEFRWVLRGGSCRTLFRTDSFAISRVLGS